MYIEEKNNNRRKNKTKEAKYKTKEAKYKLKIV